MLRGQKIGRNIFQITYSRAKSVSAEFMNNKKIYYTKDYKAKEMLSVLNILKGEILFNKKMFKRKDLTQRTTTNYVISRSTFSVIIS